MSRRILALFVVSLAALGLPLVAATPVGAGTPGVAVTLLPAFYGSNLTGVDVAVCVDGVVVTEDAPAGQLLELNVPAGGFNIQIGLAESPASCADLTFVNEDVDSVAGELLVAYNGANEVGGAQPELAVVQLPDCSSEVADLSVFHGANAEPVDVQVDGATVISDLANGELGSASVAAATADIEAVLSPGGDPVAGASGVVLSQGTTTLAVVIGGVGGSPETRTFGMLTFDWASCPPATTTTAPATTTTAAATPLVEPRFTG